VLKHSNEAHDMPVGPFGRSQGKRADSWEEVSKVSSNLRHDTGDVQVFYPEFLDVGQRPEVTQGTAVESDLGGCTVVQVGSFADLELLDQGEQTEFVHVPE
jgi:hypothetical protein